MNSKLWATVPLIMLGEAAWGNETTYWHNKSCVGMYISNGPYADAPLAARGLLECMTHDDTSKKNDRWEQAGICLAFAVVSPDLVNPCEVGLRSLIKADPHRN